MAKKGRKLTLIGSRYSSKLCPNLGLKNHVYYECEGIDGVLINGPKIKKGFNVKRIYSWLVFELRLLLWSTFQKKQKPDVIIVSSLSLLTFLSGIILKRKYKCKLVVEVRDIWPLTIIETKKWNANNIFIKFLSFVEKQGYKKADAIIGSMPNLKEYVKKIVPSSENKVHYMPMGFDTEYFNRSNGKPDPFTSFFDQIPNDHFIVGYAGSIGLANCVDQIMEAAKILKDEPIVFEILGMGSLKDDMMSFVEKEKLANVHFHDRVAKEMVAFFLSHADLLINPWKGGNTIYQYGVSPNKWIDYMNSAKPILVSYDGYPCIINEAKCGKFIKADNPKIMAEEILKFSKMNKPELKEMGENGRKYLIEKLSYETLASRYLEIIDAL